jgi:hypothetical protein
MSDRDRRDKGAHAEVSKLAAESDKLALVNRGLAQQVRADKERAEADAARIRELETQAERLALEVSFLKGEPEEEAEQWQIRDRVWERPTVREAFDLLLEGRELSDQEREYVEEARAGLDNPADTVLRFADGRERIHPRNSKRQAVFEFGSMIRPQDYESEEGYLDARQWELNFTGSLLRDILGRTFLVAAKELASGINFGDAKDPQSNRGRIDAAFALIYDMLYGV